jgi:hypothetical protein
MRGTRFFMIAGISLILSSPLFGNGSSTDKINGDRDANKAGGVNPNATGSTGNQAQGGVGAVGSRGAYKAPPSDYNEAKVTAWVNAHKQSAGQGFRYVYLSPATAANREMANTLRVAAAKMLNHLSWNADLEVPQDISDGHGLVFAMNVQKLWGANTDRFWGLIAACTPKASIGVRKAGRRNCTAFSATDPVLIERFVFNASNGNPYAQIFNTPGNYSSFRNRYRLGPIQMVSTHRDAIVCGPRITAYRSVQLPTGGQSVYSYTTDEFFGRNNGQIRYTTRAPTTNDQRSTGALNAGPGNGSTQVASEWWIQLPNGFMYWGIHGEGSQERGVAEFPFAIDPANWTQSAELVIARSCITCHAAGVQSAQTDPEYDGRNGWTSNAQLNQFYGTVRGKFQNSMKVLVTALSDGDSAFNERLVNGTIEPVAKAIMLIEGPYRGSNGQCNSFCQGKFGPRGKKMCDSLPTR